MLCAAAVSGNRALRTEFGAGVGMSVFRNYLVLDAPTNGMLEILRFIHGARNLPQVL